MTTSNEQRETELVGQKNVGEVLVLPFPLHNVDDLLITEFSGITELGTLMVRGVNYSVTTGDKNELPVLTVLIVLTNNVRWRIRRLSQMHQTLALGGTVLPFESLEAELDRLSDYNADMKGEFDRCFKIPDGELAVSGGNKVDDIAIRKGKYLFYDATTGALTVASVPTIDGAITATADGVTLIESTASGMRDFLDLVQNPMIATGDLLTAFGIGHAATRITAPTQPGRVLMTNPANLPETAGATNLAPTWQRPWLHPLADLQGFRIAPQSAAPTTTLSITRGVATPLHRVGATGTFNTYITDGRDLRIDGAGGSSGTVKRINGTFVVGGGNGGLRSGIGSIANSVLYAFAIGRASAPGEEADIIFDNSIIGTSIAADAAVVTWLGGAKLSVRRIASLLIDGSSLIRPFHSVGDWLYIDEPLKILSAGSIGTSNVSVNPLTPEEPCIVKLYCEWTPTAADDKLSIRNIFTSGNPTWASEVKARGVVTGQVQSFEMEILVEDDQDLQAITDNATGSNLDVWQVAYCDSRLDTHLV